MTGLTPQEIASIFMSGAALLLLASLFFTTSIYRERGRFDDRLFFYLILIDTVIAICDGIAYVVDEHIFMVARVLAVFSNTTMLFFCTLFGALFFALIHYRIYRSEDDTKRVLRVLYVIEAIVLLAELLNIPFGFFFHISPKNVFIYGSFFGGLRVFIYVYIFLACLMALYARQTKSLGKYVPTAMIVLMLITDYTTLYLIEDLSIYAITRAMMLGFLHMAILNEEFYGKDGDTE